MLGMLGEGTAFEWQVGESDDWDSFEPVESVFEAEEPDQKSEPAPHRASGRWRRVRGVLRIVMVVAVLVAAVAGYGFWRDYQAGIRHIRADIQGTVDAEAWIWQQNSGEPVADTLMDSQADDGWAQNFRWSQEWRRRWANDAAQASEFQIERVQLRENVALVEVLATHPGEPWMSTPYRETRFYRRVDDRWLRTSPQAEFWGPQRRLETDYFRFDFHQRDAESLAPVLTEVDGLYAELRRDAGLDAPTRDEKLTIDVVPSTDVVTWRFIGDELTVPSPALLKVPEEVTATVQLRDSIYYPLAGRVMHKAQRELGIDSKWEPVIEGVQHWLSWEENPLPSAWRYHVEGLLQEELAASPPVHLAGLITDGRRPWNRADWWMRIVAAESVVDYAVETYGRERLPALVQALGEHETWDTLIPAVFGVSLADFEAGWRGYLEERFAAPAGAPSQKAEAGS